MAREYFDPTGAAQAMNAPIRSHARRSTFRAALRFLQLPPRQSELRLLVAAQRVETLGQARCVSIAAARRKRRADFATRHIRRTGTVSYCRRIKHRR